MTFTQEIEQHNRIMTERQNRIKELEAENKQLKEQLQTWQTAYSELRQHRDELKAELKSIKGE